MTNARSWAVLVGLLAGLFFCLRPSLATAHSLDAPATLVLFEESDNLVRVAADAPSAIVDRVSISPCDAVPSQGPGRTFRCTGPLRTLRTDRALGIPLVVQLQHRDGRVSLAVLSPGQTDLPLPTPSSPSQVTPRAWLADGARHVFQGFDHVLFLLCLCAHVGLAAGAQRGYTQKSVRALAFLVSGFTLGHAASLSAFLFFALPSPGAFGEACIALTLVLSARLALRHSEQRPGATTTLVYGLVHGAGIAVSLRETGLPDGTQAASLLAFNVGVELAQLCLVALAGFAIVTGRSRWPRGGTRVAQTVAFATGISGTYLLLVRVW